MLLHSVDCGGVCFACLVAIIWLLFGSHSMELIGWSTSRPAVAFNVASHRRLYVFVIFRAMPECMQATRFRWARVSTQTLSFSAFFSVIWILALAKNWFFPFCFTNFSHSIHFALMSDCKYRAVAWFHMRCSIMICGGRGNDHFHFFFFICKRSRKMDWDGKRAVAAEAALLIRETEISNRKHTRRKYLFFSPERLGRRALFILLLLLYSHSTRQMNICFRHLAVSSMWPLPLMPLPPTSTSMPNSEWSECCVFAKIIIIVECSFDECNLHCVYKRS